jgi:4-hydroxybenzoate polyprenyltransferase
MKSITVHDNHIPATGLATTTTYNARERIAGFLGLVRPIFFILTPLNAASAAVLALPGYPPFAKCILGFLSVAFASCTINVLNDYIDRKRDKSIWPDRPIPSGRIKPGEALAVAFTSAAISLSLAWFFFNKLTFLILLLSMVLGAFYSAYLRDKVGYLSLPPIVGLIYLGGWAAFSPETVFTNWLPWYLYLLGIFWQTAHILIYYPLHTVPDEKAPPVLFSTTHPQTAVRAGIIFTWITLFSGLALIFAASLNVFYIVIVMAAGIYALISSFRLNKNIRDKQQNIKAFISLSLFRMAISAGILLSVLITWF